MSLPKNGMPAVELTAAQWRKARISGAVGNCVEIAPLATGEIAMRNSRFPAGPALIFTKAELAAFIDGAKKEEFRDLV